MGKNKLPNYVLWKNTQPNQNVEKTQRKPTEWITMKQQIVPHSSHTSNFGKQGSLLNNESNAPFTIDNGGINAGSMRDQEERTSPTSKTVYERERPNPYKRNFHPFNSIRLRKTNSHHRDSGQTIRNPEGTSWRECRRERSGLSASNLMPQLTME